MPCSVFIKYRASTSTRLPFCCQVVSDSLWPHGFQHSSLPCPLPSPEFALLWLLWLYSPWGRKVLDTTEWRSLSCPLSVWRHPAISSSVVPFASVIWLLSKFSAHLQPLLIILPLLLFIWLHWVSVVAHTIFFLHGSSGIFSYDTMTLSCSMWDLVPWQGSNPSPLHWELRVLATEQPVKSLPC